MSGKSWNLAHLGYEALISVMETENIIAAKLDTAFIKI